MRASTTQHFLSCLWTMDRIRIVVLSYPYQLIIINNSKNLLTNLHVNYNGALFAHIMKNKKKTKSSKKTKLVIPNKEVTSLRPDMVLIEPNDRGRNYNANNLMDVWLVIRILTLVIGNLTLVLGLKSKVISLLTLIMFIKTLVESIQALVMGHG